MNREWTTILEYEIEGGCGRKVKGGGGGGGGVCQKLKAQDMDTCLKGGLVLY